MTDLSPRLWFESLHTRWWSAVDADFRGHALDAGPLGGLVEQAWSAGGKRLRALLPLALAEAVGADPRALLAWAGACEVVHNGTLVHDDLQDGDTLRRGKPALWTVHGAAQAINAGSAMYVVGFLQVDRCAGSPDARARALARLQRGLLRVVDGQTREFVASDRREPSGMTSPAYFPVRSPPASGE